MHLLHAFEISHKGAHACMHAVHGVDLEESRVIPFGRKAIISYSKQSLQHSSLALLVKCIMGRRRRLHVRLISHVLEI